MWIIYFSIALILSLLLTPLAKTAAFKFGILAKPGQHKIHKESIPLTGDAAVLGATLLWY